MMPAYSRSRWSCIFFIVYLSIELYFIMNLLLAVVFDTFNGVEKNSSLVFQGRRSRTKSDLSMKMYEEEIQEWYEEYSRTDLPQPDCPLHSDQDRSDLTHSIN
ncbi:Two pore calcium channel protein 1 [Bagarius yarrelli]|uniref:Two pore calcium channel protein 1 n=1 Tax=Bagarius yarrelli TaxID=175774 RepID=A0A556V1P3_BAGYA|nr:Two pore calcium channel protein 1 [Bagarius yarrelli]